MRLRPSPQPRGIRPYVFTGQYQGDSVPGCIIKPDAVIAPLDAAWKFAGEGLQIARSPGSGGVSLPNGVNVTGLYDFQAAGAIWLAQQDWALLSDEMGIGKSVQALRAAESRLGHAYPPAGPTVLILCPALAKHHWAREVKKWTDSDSLILDGLSPRELRSVNVTARYVIANYDILYGLRRRDAAGKLIDSEKHPGWAAALAAVDFPIVICDEAHMLRGQRSRRTLAVKKVAARATCVWLLTGTPMPNHVRDLWSLWDLASDGLAGWYWPWCKRYAAAEKGVYGWRADGQSNVEELRNRLSFWMLGRTKAQVGLQLPPFRREVVPVDVGSVLAPSVVFGSEPQDIDKRGLIDSALRRTARAKRPAVAEMAVDALAAGQKVVVFVYLREQAEVIGANLAAGYPTTVVTGAQSPGQRDVAAKVFRESLGACAFVATIDSVGVAISLVGADLVIFGDLSYEPAKLLQAEGRVHRIGSSAPVLVRYVTAAGTIDDAVIETVVGKLDTFQDVLGDNPDQKALQSSLGYVRPTTSAVVAALFERLVHGS